MGVKGTCCAFVKVQRCRAVSRSLLVFLLLQGVLWPMGLQAVGFIDRVVQSVIWGCNDMTPFYARHLPGVVEDSAASCFVAINAAVDRATKALSKCTIMTNDDLMTHLSEPWKRFCLDSQL